MAATTAVKNYFTPPKRIVKAFISLYIYATKINNKK